MRYFEGVQLWFNKWENKINAQPGFTWTKIK